jgi:putative redox protein
VTGFEVGIHLERSEVHPKVFTQGLIEYEVTGHSVEEAAVARSIELSVTRYCPAYAMFSKVFPIQLHYTVYEDEGAGRRKLVAEGYYVPDQTGIQA